MHGLIVGGEDIKLVFLLNFIIKLKLDCKYGFWKGNVFRDFVITKKNRRILKYYSLLMILESCGALKVPCIVRYKSFLKFEGVNSWRNGKSGRV
jgi:hypothetical protein